MPNSEYSFVLTCQTESRHSLKFGLLQPLPHPAKRLPPAFQLAPGFGIPEEVAQRALAATEHALREDRLRNGVALQLGGNPGGEFFGVDFFEFSTPTAAPAATGSRAGRGGRRSPRPSRGTYRRSVRLTRVEDRM